MLEVKAGGHDLDPELNASPAMYKEFIESAVWQDMERFLTDRMEIVRDDLIHAADATDFRALQQEAKAIKIMIRLPHFLREQATQDIDRDKNNG